MIKKLLRDNEIINPILRNAIKVLHTYVTSLNRITSAYRIYGTVRLEISGMELKIFSKGDDLIANEIFYDRGYEASEFRLVKELTKKARYFLDIGANTGIFSIYAALSNPKLNVMSFEPHPHNFDRMLENISINNLGNIKGFSIALGSVNRGLEFTIPRDSSISTISSANAAYTKNFHKIDYKTVTVPQQTIDEVLLDVPITPRDIIKIDVEYYELEVLKGAQTTLSQKRPLVLIEILQYESLVAQFPEMKGKIDAHHARDIFNFLLMLNYHCYSIDENGLNQVTTLADQHNRNYLFVPYKLTRNHYAYEELTAALTE